MKYTQMLFQSSTRFWGPQTEAAVGPPYSGSRTDGTGLHAPSILAITAFFHPETIGHFIKIHGENSRTKG